MSQRLKNVWANHRTGCLVAGALAAGCGLALAVRAFRKRPRASPGARLLGVSERAIYEVSQRKRGGMTVAFMARLHGPRVTLDALSVALAQLQHRHPALRSVVTDLGGGSKSKLSAMELTPSSDVTIPVHVVERADDQSWLQEWQRLEKHVSRPGSSIAQALLVQPTSPAADERSAESFEIVLIVNHAFCDGISISHAMHDLLSVLCENASLERLDWSPPMEDLCKATIGGGPVFGGLKQAWNLVKLMATMKPYADCCQVPVADTSISYVDLPTKTVTATVYADLDRTTTAALIRACRAHGTTVTAAVGAALVQTVGSMSAAANDQADRAEDGSLLPVVMFCGADTRRRYEPELARHHLAYHVSGVPPYHFNMAAGDNAQKASLWRVTSEIRAEWMAALQRRVPIIFGNLIGDMWGTIFTMKEYGPRKYSGSTSISSWGVLPFKQTYGSWSLVTARPSVNMSHGRLPITLVSTVNGELTVTILAPSPAYSHESLDAIRAGLVERLSYMASAAAEQ